MKQLKFGAPVIHSLSRQISSELVAEMSKKIFVTLISRNSTIAVMSSVGYLNQMK